MLGSQETVSSLRTSILFFSSLISPFPAAVLRAVLLVDLGSVNHVSPTEWRRERILNTVQGLTCARTVLSKQDCIFTLFLWNHHFFPLQMSYQRPKELSSFAWDHASSQWWYLEVSPQRTLIPLWSPGLAQRRSKVWLGLLSWGGYPEQVHRGKGRAGSWSLLKQRCRFNCSFWKMPVYSSWDFLQFIFALILHTIYLPKPLFSLKLFQPHVIHCVKILGPLSCLGFCFCSSLQLLSISLNSLTLWPDTYPWWRSPYTPTPTLLGVRLGE